MTDAPAPRIRRGSPRANPAPRRALPRVTPLGAGGDVSGVEVDVLPVPAMSGEADAPATGRDLLIPSGSQPARRRGRGPATVPSLAELMPPPEQRGGKKAHPPGPPTIDLDRPDKALRAAGKTKHGKSKSKTETEEPAKEVALQVTLSKGLRKRLKGKAAEIGLSPEAAVAQLVEVWVDG
jgi:hypothetical protein